MKSKYCNKEIRVDGDTTKYYVCEGCNLACDGVSAFEVVGDEVSEGVGQLASNLVVDMFGVDNGGDEYNVALKALTTAKYQENLRVISILNKKILATKDLKEIALLEEVQKEIMIYETKR